MAIAACWQGEALIYESPIGRSITPERTQYPRLVEATKSGSVTRAQLARLAQNLTCTGLINTIERLLLGIMINTATVEPFEKFGLPIVFESSRQLAVQSRRFLDRV
ncbi:helix-turn-helix domain-containing protein [Sinorhizobium meliloti]|uniref:helix-turn-helix domain-containing protein n=1 Tax=Rhizobium meliloti TaxID=382 RepID=UPI003987F7D6